VSPERLAGNLGLFKLGWQADPSLLPRAAKQRGSRDNDYLTDASGPDIDALMRDFAERFAALAPLFVPKRHIPEAAQPLPLQTYYIPVPAIYAPSRTGEHPIKVEFHIDIADMPPSEEITRTHFALPDPIRATVPKVPYQVALKLLTLADPPVGLDVSRDNALPRQVYDLDELTQVVKEADAWAEILAYANTLYAKEAMLHELVATDGEPWRGIDRRLQSWVAVDTDRELAGHVNAFQVTQMPTVTRRPMVQWRARFRRVQIAAYCAAARTDGYALWRAALDVEAGVPENVRGKAQLRRYREPITRITGAPAGQYAPRVHLWEGLATAENLATATAAIAAALSDEPAATHDGTR
jgi:hypothetical protein